MGQISKASRFLIMGLWKEKKWGAKHLIKEFHGKRRPKTSIARLLQKKLTATGQSKGSRANTIMMQ